MSRVTSLNTLHNLCLPQLADAYGSICAEIRGLEARRDAIKAAILAAAKSNEIDGSAFRVTISASTRSSIDLEAAKEKLGARWVARHSKSTPVTSLRAIAIAAPAALAA